MENNEEKSEELENENLEEDIDESKIDDISNEDEILEDAISNDEEDNLVNDEESNEENASIDEEISDEVQKVNNDLLIKDVPQEEKDDNFLGFLKSSLTYVLSCLIYFVVCHIAKQFKVNRLAFAFKDNTITIVMKIFIVAGALILIAYLLNLLVKPINKFFKKIKKNVIEQVYSLFDLFSIIPVCFTIVTVFFCFFMSVAKVDGSSMEYTIEDNQTVVVSYLREIKRFDCVIVSVNENDNFSVHQDDFYIKRVIGVAGDKVRWDSLTGELYVNDELIDEVYLSDETIANNVSETGYNSFNGPFKIKENGKTVLSDIVPEGYYFVMGDNRGVSKDSRMIGLIKKDNILGKVVKAF